MMVPPTHVSYFLLLWQNTTTKETYKGFIWAYGSRRLQSMMAELRQHTWWLEQQTESSHHVREAENIKPRIARGS